MAKLEELLPTDELDELSAGELFERLELKRVEVVNGEIAMSSGCISYNNFGDGGGKGKLYNEGYERNEKPYKQ